MKLVHCICDGRSRLALTSVWARASHNAKAVHLAMTEYMPVGATTETKPSWHDITTWMCSDGVLSFFCLESNATTTRAETQLVPEHWYVCSLAVGVPIAHMARNTRKALAPRNISSQTL